MPTEKLTVRFDEVKAGDKFPGGGTALRDAYRHRDTSQVWIEMDAGVVLEDAWKTIKVWRAEPIYKHDCEACIFLGTWSEQDLYFCAEGKSGTVIARYHDEGPEYVSASIQYSMPEAGEHYPALAEALRRARARRLG